MTRQVSVRFSDSQTGAGVNIPVQATGQDQQANTLLANTNVASEGYLTSIELQADFQNTTLIVKANGSEIGKASGNGNNVAQFSRTQIANITINLSAS
ncbi:hypothetical protein H2198_007541 [Neophaeococcomyces mojaviensis]|uniref:Uncharacterized protein n=1 Tax=Neophaeococcomyces mojaviensis TaxID=3383035 RepID=A0ACC2ZZM0_9EURO|nr:hypothetical protein H2198_007541 [Knufia sp. JES_112]